MNVDVWNCPTCNGTARRSDGLEGRPAQFDDKKQPIYFCKPCQKSFPGGVESTKPGGEPKRKYDIDATNKDVITKHSK